MLTFVIPTPGAVRTGGPEALHQLADAINRSGKARALTFYVGGRHKDVVGEYQALYQVEETKTLQHPGAVLVLAEIYNPRDFEQKGGQWAGRWVWWLSAERFFPFEQYQGFGHLFQSEYARRKWQVFGFSGLMLTDYIRSQYFDSVAPVTKSRLVAINGSKGVLFAASVARECGDLEIVALKGMSSDQVCATLDRATVYLDLGWHPGRDRLPREAALRGCVVVTGVEGASSNAVDIPVPKEYKLNPGNPGALAALLRAICDQPEVHRQQQAAYAQAIRQQARLFEQEVDTLIEMSARAPDLGVSLDNRYIPVGMDLMMLETEYLLRTYRRVSNDLAYDACFGGRISAREQRKRLPAAQGEVLISVVVCSIDPDKLAAVRRNYGELMQDQAWEFIHIPDAKSLCEGYNRGFERARGRYIVFSHDDIEILNADFAEAVVDALQQADIVGVAGTTQLPGPAWSRSLPQTRAGQVGHPTRDGRVQLEIYGVHKALAGGMQALDGVLLAVRREVFERVRFDEQTFDAFHLYDIDFCFAAYKAGLKLAVSNRIFLVHASVGNFDSVWQEYAGRFRRKWAGAYWPQPELPVRAKSEVYTTREELKSAFARNLDLAERGLSSVDTRTRYDIHREKTSLQELDAQLLAERMVKTWTSRPTLTLLTVVRQAELVSLVRTLDSLQAQFYKQWRLIVISDLPCPDSAFQQADVLGWVQLTTLDDAGVLAEACNQILAQTQSEWSALLPPGVCFEADALISIADYGHLHPEWQLIYTDDDRYLADGSFVLPRFKPDFCPDFFLASDYVTPTAFVRWKALSRVGGYLPQGGAESFDLALRVYENLGASTIGHIAKPLLHLPEHHFVGDATAGRLAAVQAHFERLQVEANVLEGLAHQTLRISYPAAEAKASLVIPFRNGLGWLRPCVQSIFAKTRYADFELILVDHASDDPELAAWIEELQGDHPGRVQHMAYDGEFNLAHAWNLGAARAQGEYLVLLHSDVQIVQPDWLQRLIGHAQRPEIGIVGPKLVYPESGLVQNGGTILGFGSTGCASLQNFALHEPGYLNVLACEQNHSVITGACLVLRTGLFRELEGLDAERFPTLHADADLSLRAVKAGYRNLWTPAAVLVHLESQTRREQGLDPEFQMQLILAERRQLMAFHQQWRESIAHDPAYNRHLTLGKGAPFDIETELTVEWDKSFHDRPRVAGQQMAGGVGEYRYFRPLRALMLAGRVQSTLIQTEKYNAGRLLTLAELERLEPDVYLRHAWTSPSDQDWQRLYKACAPQVRYVFQLDDLVTHLPPEHPNIKTIPRDARYRLRQLLSMGDALIVSTEPLRELALDMIGEVHVVPNMLSTEKWGALSSLRRQGDKLRVGWAGAQQHKGDLALIHDVVRATAEEVDWVFFGMCPEALRPYVREVHEFIIDLEAYPAKLATLNLDLAIAPLEIHPFNEAKSNLRLLEYGALGWPVICTDIYPYRTGNPPVTRLPNVPQLWVDAIRERVAQPDVLQQEGDALRAWVWRHFRLEEHLDQWQTAIIGR